MNLADVKLAGANLSRANLSGVKLSEADLRSANLGRAVLTDATLWGANLTDANVEGANLRRANLRGADLGGAKLTGADLRETSLYGVKLGGADLREGDLRGVNLHAADLREVKLTRAELSGADLSGANLWRADLADADLSRVNLRGADLTEANLRSATLQSAVLDGAVLTGARLWETQRATWSIKGVVCERACWDEAGAAATGYAPGEFERLYSEQPRIELLYKGGITKFELNTLPALLYHLTALNPDCNIRLKSVEETAGGAKVSLIVEEADSAGLERIKAEAERSQAAQIALRDDPQGRWEIEKRLLLDEVFPRMIAAAGQHVQIGGNATGLVVASGNATVHARQTINDLPAIRSLLDQVMSRSGELRPEFAGEVESAIREVQGELQKSQPRHAVVSEGLKSVRDFVVGALGGAAGTALATNTWAAASRSVVAFREALRRVGER